MERDREWIPGTVGLWIAVVVQVVEDLRGRIRLYSAREWVQSSDGGIGSLAWICDALGLEVEQVRGRALGDVAPRTWRVAGVP